jgi:MmyB-like transcription regulator ligand binding domain
LRRRNALLIAAGFAPLWRETEFGAPELKQVRRVLDYMLSQQEPFPAAAVDRRWNLVQANDGAVRLVEFLVGPLAPGAKINLADALVAPDVLRPYLARCRALLHQTAALLERLIRYKGVRAVLRTRAADLAAATAGPVLPMRFRKGAVALELFTTIAPLGTQDITLQELRIESFFPMDADTARVLRAWAKPKRTRARQSGPRSGQPQIGQL